MRNRECNTGFYLNGIDAHDLRGGWFTLIPEIFILKVPGGNIYYRDVLIMDDEKIPHFTQTATFVPDKD